MKNVIGRSLKDVRVLEFAGLGPGPHACMIFADLGADVVRVERPESSDVGTTQHTLRGRTIVQADLKSEADLQQVRALARSADVLVEGFRPGVMERLGLGPKELVQDNPGLIYARMTGWGQDGPLAQRAGHDINYISLTGALHAIGREDQPWPPINLVGDFGGGSMLLVIGVLAALFERERTGAGQVIDAAMVDGVSMLLQPLLELRAMGMWQDSRESNILDGAAPYYRTYACADGRFMAVGAVEPQFYALLVQGLGLTESKLPDRNDPRTWPELTKIFVERFAAADLKHWTSVFEGVDACVTPVLTVAEAPDNDHISARGSLVNHDGGSVVAAPAPRFQPQGEGFPWDPTSSRNTVSDSVAGAAVAWTRMVDARA